MKMVHVLFGTVLTAAVVAGVRSMAGSPAPVTDAPVAEPTPNSPAAQLPDLDDSPPAAAQAPSAGIAGEVLEVIDVPNYSYLRVGAKGSDGTWVAVPTAGLSVGASVRVGSAMKMTDFKSTALNRTFPVIYFGTLDKGAGAAAQAGDDPHGAMGDNPHGAMGDNPHGAMGDSPHGAMGAMGDNPHAGMSDNPHGAAGASDPHGGMHGAAGASTVDVKSVPRADGPNGKTVAEVIGQRASLTGKTVRIRATVVKVNAGILGRTYLHLRDGSGDASAGTNDIVVTTESTPGLGDTVVVEGKVILDKDIGAGYKFPTMVEDAKIL